MHSALPPILDCPAQLRWLAMNVAPEGDLRVKTSALKLGRLVRDLQSLFPVRRSCSGPQSRSHPDHIDAGRPELLDIKIDDPVELPAPLPAYLKRVMSRASQPVAIGVRVEPWLRPFPEMHGHHRLGDSVRDPGHTKRADPATMRLRDHHRPHRWRKVGARAHPIPDLVEVIPQISLELLQRLPIHSRSTLVLLDLPPSLPNHRLGNHKRLVLWLWHVSSLPPEAYASVDRIAIPGELAPWLHPHPSKQGSHSYYGPVRQRALHRYSMTTV